MKLHGIKVPHKKNTANCVPVRLSVPETVRIPMSMHIGKPAKVAVKRGDTVKVGQLIGEADGFISAPVHSSVSGTVAKIEEMTLSNGAKGQCVVIDTDGEQISVDYDGRIASYGFDSLLELEHAWAMTVHKSQGSEYRAVVLALAPGAQMLMTRDVLYTAVTRARELLIMVGDDQTAYQMIDHYQQTRRYSALRVRLRALAGVQT